MTRQLWRFGMACLLAAVAVPVLSSQPLSRPRPLRPEITGISHVGFFASDPAASERFYVTTIGATKLPDPEETSGVRYYISPSQYVEILPLPPDHSISRMAYAAFATPDTRAMRDYLLPLNLAGMSPLHEARDGSRWFAVNDPEGNQIRFVEAPRKPVQLQRQPVSTRLIHVGFLVHDREREDAFYQQVMGFRPYWKGGMQAGKIDWISEQVPDGDDWLEYMMVGDNSDVPLSRVDHGELGGMNHISLGVVNMEASVTELLKQNLMSPHHNGPQMGRDGKWQANLFDPDGTRIELMEFQPVMPPCCSPFTASNPRP